MSGPSGRVEKATKLGRGGKTGVKPADLAVLAVVLAATVAAALLVYAQPHDRLQLEIEAPGGKWLYPLTDNREVAIAGPLGDTLIQIVDGQARIIDSPCPNKTCIAHPPIANQGDWNACLPNRVIIRVTGVTAGLGQIDAVAE